MDQNQKKELYRRYINGDLNEQELLDFTCLMANGELQDLMPDIDEIAAEYHINWGPSEHIGQKITNESSILKNRRKIIWNAAAVITGFLLVFGGYREYIKYVGYQKTLHFYTVKVPLGKTIEVKLADGTQVRLASGSIFKYPEAFSEIERRVYLLEGKAFFDVFKNRNKPFTVQSNTLATTALGTSFIVENYKNYNFEKISLYSGKVRIDQSKINEKVFLIPGQQYAYNNNRSIGERKKFNTASASIESGVLIFDDTSLEEAIYSISSYYQIHIQFNPKDFKANFISGTFKNQSPAQVLKTMSHLYRFKVKNPDPRTYLIIPMKH